MVASMTKRIMRGVAGVLAVVLLAVVLFSSYYIAREAGHHCEGEECPICENIRQCEAVLQQLGLGIILVASLVMPTVWSLITRSLRAYMFAAETLVSRKVRLND